MIRPAIEQDWEQFYPFLLESFRKQGIGKALFLNICNWAKITGATWLEWYASPSAIDFYKKLGYKGTLNPNPDHRYYEIELR
ncbi:MAG: GNAT family N-acetyltransferase [Waterburya sp.]